MIVLGTNIYFVLSQILTIDMVHARHDMYSRQVVARAVTYSVSWE